MEAVTLVGAEEVARAGHAMQDAAASFRQSVGHLEEAFEREARRRTEVVAEVVDALEGFVQRIEKVLHAQPLVVLERTPVAPDDKWKGVLDLVADQARDEGLWFTAVTAPEGYLQQELRKLHDLIEAVARS